MRSLKHVLLLGIVSFASAYAETTPKPAHDKWDQGDFSRWRNRPTEPFTNGKAMFEKVKDALRKDYLDSAITDDDLYRAATEGMLSRIDPDMAAGNRLMTPTEYAEMTSDMKGQVVGIGVEVGFSESTGYADVIGVIPGSPSDKAGIVRGDQILRIDDQGFRGKQLRDVVYAIRGKTGSSIKLKVLHEDRIVTLNLKREAITWDTVDAKLLGDGIGLVSIRYFTDTTPNLLSQALKKVASDTSKGLIIDLRNNEGGVFDRAVDAIRQFVPSEKPIVKVLKRDHKQEDILGKTAPIFKAPSLIVLINGNTKSGAEIMAEALKQSAGAVTVGTHTFGKWSAQHVESLSNGFAMKYTIAKFLAPDGSDLSGKGVSPDITVDSDADQIEKLQKNPDITARLKEDIQLQTAVHVIEMRQQAK